MIRLPGLIDPHVHLRYMDSHKEDFLTGSYAAIAGGFTMVLDMPNNNPPITTFPRLQSKIDQASHYTRYDLGFHFGSLGDNLDEFEKVKDMVYGLKLYLNMTTGGFIIDAVTMKKIYKKWNTVTEGKKPILLHAEEDVIDMVVEVVKETKQPTHICHVSTAEELIKIAKVKETGLPITCSVTPHHLFLTHSDEKRLGPFGLMKPSLKSQKDHNFIWSHLDLFDIVESDHAPHTIKEKQSKTPPFGVPGLETTLPLLLTAMSENKISKEQIIDKCFTQPKKIFHLPTQKDTYIEVDEKKKWILKNSMLHTKCGWSPFDGWEMQGKLVKVVIRNKIVFKNDKILVKGGFGKIL